MKPCERFHAIDSETVECAKCGLSDQEHIHEVRFPNSFGLERGIRIVGITGQGGLNMLALLDALPTGYSDIAFEMDDFAISGFVWALEKAGRDAAAREMEALGVNGHGKWKGSMIVRVMHAKAVAWERA